MTGEINRKPSRRYKSPSKYSEEYPSKTVLLNCENVTVGGVEAQ